MYAHVREGEGGREKERRGGEGESWGRGQRERRKEERDVLEKSCKNEMSFEV